MFNTKNQCSKCNAMCRIEGCDECWDLCTCECHVEKATIVDDTYSFMSNGEFGLKTGIEKVWEKMSAEERQEYINIKLNGVVEEGFIRVSPNDFLKCFDFCAKMKEKYG